VRYVGLMFLGMVLWAGQASAAVFKGKEAAEIISDGEIIHSHLRNDLILILRVLYKGDYFICKDGNLTEAVYLQRKSTLD